ncbi:MAG: response regulator transcription factor [Deltaproteobacteria bacterium]|nr:response regulator transcription factor [Deltaproteobacteria bacterium]
MEFFNRPSLDEMIFMALITDGDGHVLWCNPLAKDNIPELDTSDKLPDGLRSSFKKITGFFQKEYDPFIYREVEASTPYGSSVCFAIDDSASKYLPVKGGGFLFVLNSNRLSSAVVDSLTDREKDVLRLIANGKFDKEIADTLFISTHTINSHMKSIFNKLKVSNRTEAAVKAIKLGIM